MLGLAFLYQRYLHKMDTSASSQMSDYDAIQKYLLTDETFYDSPDRNTKWGYDASTDGNKSHQNDHDYHKFRPILWIHLDYQYNSRKWNSFGSRSSHHLNQPYLYLTIKTIIDQCKNSFRICIIDDEAFFKLIPNWSVHLNTVSNPIQGNLRFLGCLRLLEMYGGILVPPSFLCMRDLIGIYNMGTGNHYVESSCSSSSSSSASSSDCEVFVAENHNRNITSTEFLFAPDISFIGAKRNAPLLHDLIDFVQRTVSVDHTDQLRFLGGCRSR